MNVGDLVTSSSGGAPEALVGVVLSSPYLTWDNETEVVRVDWLGWNLQEEYNTQYLKVLSKAKEEK